MNNLTVVTPALISTNTLTQKYSKELYNLYLDPKGDLIHRETRLKRVNEIVDNFFADCAKYHINNDLILDILRDLRVAIVLSENTGHLGVFMLFEKIVSTKILKGE